jgi:hypothetical protein
MEWSIMTTADDDDTSRSAPPRAPVNSGVYIGGGTFSGAAMAAGAGAQAHQVSYGLDGSGTLARIDRLLRELRDGAAMLEDGEAEAVVDDVERLSAEVHHRKPDRDSLSRLLGRITARLGSAATLLATVDQVKDLITSLLR